jgi:hypothetical protein
LLFYFHESCNFITDSSIIDSDVLYFNSEIARDYALMNKHKYRASEYCYLISNNELKQKLRARLERKNPDKDICIGLYGEGFYSRDSRFHGEKDITRGRGIERKIISFFTAYARKHSSFKFVVYPHYARGVETADGAKHFYADFLNNDNCRLNPIEKASSAEFEEVDLGVVIRSNIFWDRMFEGHSTILINPFLSGNFLEQAILKEGEFDIDDVCFEKKFNSLLERHFHSDL